MMDIKSDLFPFTQKIESSLYGIVTVPLYDTLGTIATENILMQTELKTILLSNDKIENIFQLKMQEKTGKLKNIIAMDPLEDEQRKRAIALGMEIFTYADIIKYGKEEKFVRLKFDPNSIYTLTYTSGTTEIAKGVVTTHLNMISAITVSLDFFVPTFDDVYISFLPLPHLYERIVANIMISVGAAIGFYTGDILLLKEDLQVLQPTALACVPRLLNRFYDLIHQNFNRQTGAKAKLLQKALFSKLETLKTTGKFTHPIFDKFIFSNVKQVLGGRVRVITTSSAPLSENIMDFLKVVFCCSIFEGYGQTETTGPVTATLSNDKEAGHVGGPVRFVQIKLVDIPEMRYTSKNVNEKWK